MPSFALWEIMSQRDGVTGTPAGRGLDGLAAHHVGMMSDELPRLTDDEHDQLVEADVAVRHVGAGGYRQMIATRSKLSRSSASSGNALPLLIPTSQPTKTKSPSYHLTMKSMESLPWLHNVIVSEFQERLDCPERLLVDRCFYAGPPRVLGPSPLTTNGHMAIGCSSQFVMTRRDPRNSLQ